MHGRYGRLCCECTDTLRKNLWDNLCTGQYTCLHCLGPCFHRAHHGRIPKVAVHWIQKGNLRCSSPGAKDALYRVILACLRCLGYCFTHTKKWKSLHKWRQKNTNLQQALVYRNGPRQGASIDGGPINIDWLISCRWASHVSIVTGSNNLPGWN